MIGFSEIVFLVCVGIIALNFRRLPEAVRGIREAVRNFQNETKPEKRALKNVTPPEKTT